MSDTNPRMKRIRAELPPREEPTPSYAGGLAPEPVYDDPVPDPTMERVAVPISQRLPVVRVETPDDSAEASTEDERRIRAGGEPSHRASRSILASSAVMAAGTVVSRGSGFVRSALLAAAIGSTGHADVFNVANTIPNMLYILLAGGVFNAVLVPQLVRALRNDEDGGTAYTQRIITLAGLFLGGVTVLLVLAAPWIIHLYFHHHDAAQVASAIDFARWCLPQVFFYGMFVLVGQVLNARGSFGPMMWAPIANNVVSIFVLVSYLGFFGPQGTGSYSFGQELLLGLGSTLGIVAQFLILLPYLRKAGFVFSPRFDFRGSGLGHTLRLGVWTVLFVIANQIAYTVVTILAGSGSGKDGTGYTIYSNSFLLTQVPHSIITVSLATAILPALSARAAANDLEGLGRTLTGTLRSALAVVVPVAAMLPIVPTALAQLLFGYGASADQYRDYSSTIALFAPGLVFFTVHYLMLRGLYALERNRTAFYIQCAIAATNIVTALVIVGSVSPDHTAPALAVSYGTSYFVGSLTSYAVLRRLLGDLDGRRLLRFLVRLVVVTAAATVVAGLFHAALLTYDESPSWGVTLVETMAVGVVDVCMLLLGAQAMRLTEMTSVVGQITRRLGRR
ncbi:murein biosynthesis integral membrane protein MurJ [Nocardioides sp. DS6]|uniref:Murein biosynthesis integral membrane protein MurJ n=1 Tax=Nocardioides eburneus TaxID=3231482 RepID=A0ABV3T313_9ACTN